MASWISKLWVQWIIECQPPQACAHTTAYTCTQTCLHVTHAYMQNQTNKKTPNTHKTLPATQNLHNKIQAWWLTPVPVLRRLEDQKFKTTYGGLFCCSDKTPWVTLLEKEGFILATVTVRDAVGGGVAQQVGGAKSQALTCSPTA